MALKQYNVPHYILALPLLACVNLGIFLSLPDTTFLILKLEQWGWRNGSAAKSTY